MLEIEKPLFAEVIQENPALLEKISELLAKRRIETECVIASAAEKNAITSKQDEYTAGFLAKLYSFFEL